MDAQTPMDDVKSKHEALKPEAQAAAQEDPTLVDYGQAEGDEAAPPPPTPEEEAAADPLAHPLSRSIHAHGEEIKILRWHEPTGADIEKAGSPIIIETSVDGERLRVHFDEKRMAAMIAQLAAIPPSSVKSMLARDWNMIAFKIFRFFM
jgi:hypothetical protein